MTLHDRFQKKIKDALELNGMSQGDLAMKLGVSRQMVSQYVNGAIVPGLDVVERFSRALNLSDPASLLDDSEILTSVHLTVT